MRARPKAAANRARICLLVAALAAAGCTSPSAEPASTASLPSTTSTAGETTTTTAVAVTTMAPRPIGEIPVYADDADVITIDPGVTIGALDNGLTYYIRANDRPGARAQLRLVVRAGSVQEGAGQSGAAHFVEHMLFNGTAKYPANDLIRVLQGFGSEFGPDINAYTNWEETVYELTLPTDRAELLPTGLDVLREWAAAATIDPVEVDLERGVLVEEWRLRSQSFSGRYFEGVIDRLLQGTPYEGQDTLAGPDVLEATTREALAAFYEAWYRPDNMAVVAVGDFDVEEVEGLIVSIFGDIPARQGPPPPDLSTPPAADPAFFILPDPEFRQSFVELNYPMPALPQGTVGTLRQEMALALGWDMLVTRLQEDALRGGTPYFDPAPAANPLVRTQRSPGLAASAEPGELAATAEALLGEVERALLHGFGREELDRAVRDVRSRVELEFERSGTTQDAEYADRYVEHDLGGAPIDAAAAWADLQRRLLDEMTVDQVTATFRAAIQSTEPLVIVVGPQDDAADLPTEAGLAAILERVRSANLEPRIDTTETFEQLMDAPEPAAIRSTEPLPSTSLDILTLDNGVRVILFPTTIVENVVVMGAESFGGWSLLPVEDAVEAQTIGDVVTVSGVGEHDQLALDRFLSGRIVSVWPYIDETTEGIFARGATGELETLFQLVHLYMTQPRADEIGLGIVIDEIRPYAEDPTSSPDLAVATAIADARFGSDPRFLPVPSPEDLDAFDLGRGLEIFRERFADAADFVFVLTGDFDPAAAADLAQRYLGSLPSGGSGETYQDVRTDRAAGIAELTVESGAGELGQLSLLWEVALDLDPVTRVEADLLDLVIRQRLTERIREQLSATYSPSTSVRVVDDPAPSIELSVTISADPDDLDTIAAEVIADLTDLRDHGPTAGQLQIAQEQLVRQSELFSNESLVELLIFYLLRPAEDPGDIFAEEERAKEATVLDLGALARELILLDDYIQIQLVPERPPG
ncbi:MAG: insulinase family protein [Actinobacteria bacterium]|nr:insulinase family protein [Actinomycetota bacterium]